MSTDFNIKPVGAPVAAPIVQPSAKRRNMRSRPNCRRARASRRSDARARQHRFRRGPRLHFECLGLEPGGDRSRRGAVVYQVVDNRTSQVVKQFPEEAVLRRRAYFHALDLTKDAPQRLRATDRRA